MARAAGTANQVAGIIRAAFSHVHAEANELEKKMAEWADLQDRIKQAVASAPNIVKLDTSKDTLLRVEGSYFHGLLGCGKWKPDSTTKAYYLDLDPILFRRVLIYLRTGIIMPADGLTQVERDELKAMMEYLKMCQWSAEAQLVRWNIGKKSPNPTLSNDLRTVEISSCLTWSGVIATEALEGTFRIHVDVAANEFFVGLCPDARFDCNSSDNTSRHCYRYCSTGAIYKKQSQSETQDKLQAGDLVTIQRGALEAVFTVNDGAKIHVALADPNEELFPVVFMYSGGAKVTVVE